MYKQLRTISARWSSVLRLGALAAAMACGSVGQAVVIVDMNFNGNTDNAGVGPDGDLKGDAMILLDQLFTNGDNEPEPEGAGLDLPLGSFGQIFNGLNDFLVEFDFRSVPGGSGALFSADGTLALTDPDFQAGSLNIYLGTGPDSGTTGILADFWFLGEVAVAEDIDSGIQFNDGETHHVKLTYTAATNLVELTVDALEPESDDFDFYRDTSLDIVRLGDENNPDFGADINQGFEGFFDNLRIEGTFVPEPTSLVLLALGGLLCLGRRTAGRR